MLKDVLHVWLSAMLVLLKSEYFVIASTLYSRVLKMCERCKVTHYELPFLQMKEA